MIKENRYIQLRDGVKLHTQIKEVGGPLWIVFTHGLGEHLGRHNYLLGLFSNNFNIFQYDLRGHGKSEGKRAQVQDFQDYIRDLGEVIGYIQKTFKGGRIILVGHSMGALITAGYLQNEAGDGQYPECVFLSAPPVAAPGYLGKFLKIFPNVTSKLAKIGISVPLGGLIDLHKLSHDGRVYESYVNDELNCLKVHSHLLLSLIDYANNVFARPLRSRCPIACAYGTKDAVVNPEAIKSYFTSLGKEAKLIEIEGAYHEMHNEVSRYRTEYLQHFVGFITKTFYQDEA